MSLSTTETQSPKVESITPPAVTGWLLFFCLVLTLAVPAPALYHSQSYVLPSLFGGHSPRFIFLVSVYCVVFISLALTSFIAGMKLWLVRPGAVKFARRWLWSYLIANFVYFALWLAIARHPTSQSLAKMGWDHVVGPIPSFAIWYLYLEHSKRVRATYPVR